MAQLFNVDREKEFLSAVIRTPELLAECPFITERDFSTTNRVVFSAIMACQASGIPFSKFLLIDRLNSLSIKIGDVIEPAVYINSLDLLGVNDQAAVGIAKTIKNWSIRRELYQTAQQMLKATEKDEGKKASELLAEVTGVFNQKVNLLGGTDEQDPVDLFATMEEYIESLGLYPEEEGPKAPYPLYYNLWGTFSPGDMSVYCARPKGSKSTFLMNTVEQCVEQDPDVICLMLDTELETVRVQRRMVSAMTDINEFIIRTGKWKNNPEHAAKVRKAWTRVNQLFSRISHCYVGGKSTDEMLAICRRWYGKHAAGKKKKVLICLDYIKLGSVDLDNLGAMKDYQSVGKKVDQFKQLATELQCHILTAAQTNRSNESRDGTIRRSDGAAIGLSDFISQYASNIYMLERLSLEQIATFNSIDCTHTLSCVYARNLGERGAEPLVKYQDEKNKDRWTENYLFYRIKNFRVEEVMDFRKAVERAKITGIAEAIQPEQISQGEML